VGALLLEAGTLLRAPEIAVAASAAWRRAREHQPAVICSTGDELIEPGDPLPTTRAAVQTPTPSPPPAPARLGPRRPTIMCRR